LKYSFINLKNINMKKITLFFFAMSSFLAFAQPTNNAPDPTKAPADVISIYGGTYTNVATNYDPNWGQSGHTQVNPNFNPGTGNLVLAYPNFNYQGTELTTQNAANMEFLHIDVWTSANPATTTLQVSPINNGTGAGETLVTIPFTSGSWTSIDIPKSAFTNMTWNSVFQLKFAANGPGSVVPVTIYLDNIYFWKNPTTTTQLPLVLGFESSESGGVNGTPFGEGPAPVLETGTGTNTTQVLKIVGNPAGQPWQGINLNLTSLVNLTASQTMTMDVFSADPVTFLVKVTGGVGGPGIVAASVSHPGGSTWQTVSYTFNTSLDGQPAPASGTYSGFVIHTYWAPGAVGFFNPTVPTPARTFYVDNIRGPLGTPPVIPAPTVAAPTPPARPAADVKSIFSDAYTPIATLNYADGDNTFNTSWCPMSTSLVQVAGNNTNLVTGSPCEGVSFLAGRFDATTFTHFHMDIWTPTATLDKSFNVKFSNWNNTNAEVNAIQFSVTNVNFLTNPNPGTWISLDIPLSNFTIAGGGSANRNDLAQFVISTDLGTVYYDNLYLHKNTVLSVSSFEKSNIKMYPNPATTNFTIEAQSSVENVTVYNMLGQEVIAKSPNTQQTTIDISTLKVGVYIVKATINGVVSSSRLVKE